MMNNRSFPLVTEKDKQLPFYLLSVGYEHLQEPVDRPEGFPTYQWIQSVQGEGELIVDGRKESVSDQQGMLLFPNVPHKYYSKKGEWKVHWISFAGSGTDGFIKALNIERCEVLYIKNIEVFNSKVKKILSVSQSNNHLKSIETSSIIYEVLMDILKYTSKGSNDSTEQQYMRLRPVLEFIEHNYYKTITLEELASAIHLTPQHLCVLFKNITKMRPFEYINRVRISKSKDLIINNSELEIKQIAQMVGYDNTSYFCSIFRKIEGFSPGKFKNLYW